VWVSGTKKLHPHKRRRGKREEREHIEDENLIPRW
jgi:hypothetical protein